MGGHLLRGKALTALGRLAAAALLLSALSPGVRAAALSSDASSTLPPAGAATDGQDGPLPPLQGHEAAEVFTIAIPDEDLIGRYVDGLLATRREWLQQCLDRSARYRAVISKALSEKGLPRELAFLPAIESGFQERAVSPRGAAGLWQLMRNTASP
jgi:hypothetical protein